MQKIRTIDVNSYATRKSLAVGLLDLALLTANAAQLKNILTYGPTHQFYILMYTLIIISIALQVSYLTMFLLKPKSLRCSIGDQWVKKLIKNFSSNS